MRFQHGYLHWISNNHVKPYECGFMMTVHPDIPCTTVASVMIVAIYSRWSMLLTRDESD